MQLLEAVSAVGEVKVSLEAGKVTVQVDERLASSESDNSFYTT
jgi:copper chaperone CopZ